MAIFNIPLRNIDKEYIFPSIQRLKQFLARNPLPLKKKDQQVRIQKRYQKKKYVSKTQPPSVLYCLFIAACKLCCTNYYTYNMCPVLLKGRTRESSGKTWTQSFMFFCLFVPEEILYGIELGQTMAHFCTHLCWQQTILQSIMSVVWLIELGQASVLVLTLP